MATCVASIHPRPREVGNKQGVLDVHNAMGVGKSRWGARVETVSGDGLRGVDKNNIHNR